MHVMEYIFVRAFAAHYKWMHTRNVRKYAFVYSNVNIIHRNCDDTKHMSTSVISKTNMWAYRVEISFFMFNGKLCKNGICNI
jgi:hypothetical protein